MARGTIKSVIPDRGFGFVRPEGISDQRGDVFFHIRDVDESLAFDETLIERDVVFEIAPGRDGRSRAVNVRAAR